MKTSFPYRAEETLLSVDVCCDEDVIDGRHVGEHAAYRVVIKTSQRTLVVEGDHDGGPDCEQDGKTLTA